MPDSMITKKALAAAMKKLMEKNEFQKISVGDICETCGMSRKGFYYHFRDKYDLVNWIFYTEFVTLVQEKDYVNNWAFYEDICSYFYRNRAFYIKAFQIEGQNSFTDFFGETIQPLAFAYLQEELIDSKAREFYCAFFTDAFRCAIVRWLQNNMTTTPREFVDLLRQTIYGIARAVSDAKIEKNA